MHQRLPLCGLGIIASLSAPVVAQSPGIYFKIGPQVLDESNTKWKIPSQQLGTDAIVVPEESDFPVRVEVGGEWALRKGFGLRAGLASLRIPANNYTWKQAYVDVLFTPWQRGNMRLYASAGVGFGSMSSTYMVRQASWVQDGTPGGSHFDPGEFRRVDQSSRPFLRAAGGFQVTRYFGVELNVDRVSLKRGPTDPWPSAVVNAGVNLVFRIPAQ
ncbi:MAG: hypothetical protein Q8O00_03955 [Holophaga sp.]|nr:hypothetical protein [Holophaga sp.]